MRRKRYRAVLGRQEREELRRMTRTRKARAREILRAHILLRADEGPQGEARRVARLLES